MINISFPWRAEPIDLIFFKQYLLTFANFRVIISPFLSIIPTLAIILESFSLIAHFLFSNPFKPFPTLSSLTLVPPLLYWLTQMKMIINWHCSSLSWLTQIWFSVLNVVVCCFDWRLLSFHRRHILISYPVLLPWLYCMILIF